MHDIKGMYKDYNGHTRQVPANILECLNSRFNWKCFQLRIYCHYHVKYLIEEILKYSSIFQNLELIRFDHISTADMEDFVNSGVKSFFSPSVNFLVFFPEGFEYRTVHPFVAERSYEVAFRTSDHIQWALEARKLGKSAMQSDQRINLTAKFNNLTTLWLFCRLPVKYRVCLPTVKNLFVRDYHFHEKSSPRFGLFLSATFPNVMYLDFYVGAQYWFVTGDVVLPSLVSLNTDWYVLQAFQNCTNIQHLKQRNTQVS